MSDDRLAAAEAKLAQVRNLHCVEIRYSEDDGETSQDTPTDEPCTVFEVCAECGRIEMEYAADYRESLWPCPTAKALSASPVSALDAVRVEARAQALEDAAGWFETVKPTTPEAIMILAGVSGDLRDRAQLTRRLAAPPATAEALPEWRRQKIARDLDEQGQRNGMPPARPTGTDSAQRSTIDENGQTIVHACPIGSSNVTPCCGRTPFGVLGDRMTLYPDLVTCPQWEPSEPFSARCQRIGHGWHSGLTNAPCQPL